jgi:hypothetical protein
MNSIKLSVIFIVLFSLNKLYGQSHIDSLLCKEWRMSYYIEAGRKVLPAGIQKNDRMIFYSDHKAKSIEGGRIQRGVWHYEPKTQILSVVDNDTNENPVMKIISIEEKECILEYKDPNGVILKIVMVPVSKN